MIPHNVTTIESSAFSDCKNLSTINVPESVISIGDIAFWYCINLNSINIPSSVTTIGMGAFTGCKSLTSVSIPSSISIISRELFHVCTNLREISIPTSITNIEYAAFNSCDNLTDIYYGGSKAQWASIKISTVIIGDENDSLLNATIHYNSPGLTYAIGFTDVKQSDYFADAVFWAKYSGVTDGTSDTTFSPNSTVTRAQAVTFLWRANGEPEPKNRSNPFKDVKTSDYFYKPVLWAVENGITDGTSATTFSPAQTCSTAHIITFLYRTLGIGINGWYIEARNWANREKLLTDTGTIVSPNENCSRANVVVYLYRTFGA